MSAKLPRTALDDFLGDQDESDFPRHFGPWKSFGDFDPPYARDDLRHFQRLGVIQLDERGKRFRLTLEALGALEAE
jgi:hypothetical protein